MTQAARIRWAARRLRPSSRWRASGRDAKGGKPVKVETWHDRAVDFGAFRTFDFDYTPPPGRRRGGAEFTRDSEIRGYIRSTLEKKGYRYDTEGEVDFLVMCIYHPPMSKHGGKRAGVTGRNTVTFRSNDNQLYFELRHPETLQPIWRGTAQKVLTKKDDTAERLAAAVDAAFEAFPPPPHSAPGMPPADEDPASEDP